MKKAIAALVILAVVFVAGLLVLGSRRQQSELETRTLSHLCRAKGTTWEQI